MKTIVTLIIGMTIGMYLSAQAKALHMPVFTLPHKLHIDPLAVVLIIVFAAAVFAASKKNPPAAGKRK